MRGVELTYRGQKFGEICSECEVFADMKEFSLPMRVVQVASVVLGCTVLGVSRGFSPWERQTLLETMLRYHGCGQFCPDIDGVC